MDIQTKNKKEKEVQKQKCQYVDDRDVFELFYDIKRYGIPVVSEETNGNIMTMSMFNKIAINEWNETIIYNHVKYFLKRAEALMDLPITIFNDKVQDYNNKFDSIAKPTVTYINDELLNRARAKDFIKYVSVLEKRNKIFQDYEENEIINACHNIGLFNENDNYEFLKGIAKFGLSPTGAMKVFNNLNDNSFVLVETEDQLTKQNEISEMQLVIEITSLIEAVYNKLMGITPPKKEEFEIRHICTGDIFEFISSKYANSKTKL